MTAAADRLGRLLNLVPYLLARPGIRLVDAAADLGITEAELRDDLELLWVCGLPGYGPGDLIDMSLDGDTVTITYDAGIDRPLRLTPDEALALVLALRMLVETPGLDQRDAVERAMAKIESAAGEAADTAARIAVGLPGDGDRLAETRTVLRGALDRRHAIGITYYTAGRDETTERVVDPMRLVSVGGRTYLEAWCRRAEGVRMFRLDRIDAATELDEPAAPPPQARSSDLRAGVFRPSPGQPLVTVRVERGARWITEYYPCEQVREQPDGRWLVSLRASDLEWARRFVLWLGPEAEVVGPPELVELVNTEIAAALAGYTPEPVSGDGSGSARVGRCPSGTS